MKYILFCIFFFWLGDFGFPQNGIGFANTSIGKIDSTIAIYVFGDKTYTNPEIPVIGNLNFHYNPSFLVNLQSTELDTFLCNNPIFSANGKYFACCEKIKDTMEQSGCIRWTIIPDSTEMIASFYELDTKKKLFELNFTSEYYEKVRKQYLPYHQTSFTISNLGQVVQCDDKYGFLKLFDKTGELILQKQFYPQVMPENNGEFNVSFSSSGNKFLLTLRDNRKEFLYMPFKDRSKSFVKNKFTRAFCFNQNGNIEWEYKPDSAFHLLSDGGFSYKGKYALIYSLGNDTTLRHQLTLLNDSGKVIRTYPMYYDGRFSLDENNAYIRAKKCYSIIESCTGRIIYNTDSLTEVKSIDISGKSNRIVYVSGIQKLQATDNPSINYYLLTHANLNCIDFIKNEIVWSKALPDIGLKSNYPHVKISESGEKISLIYDHIQYIFEERK